MLNTVKSIFDFFKNLTMEQVKNFFKDFGLYLFNLLKGIWDSIKSNNGQSLLYIIWAVISFLYGFTFSILVMIIYSCYIHHMQEEKCEVCNHEDILRYTLIICIFSLLHTLL